MRAPTTRRSVGSRDAGDDGPHQGNARTCGVGPMGASPDGDGTACAGSREGLGEPRGRGHEGRDDAVADGPTTPRNGRGVSRETVKGAHAGGVLRGGVGRRFFQNRRGRGGGVEGAAHAAVHMDVSVDAPGRGSPARARRPGSCFRRPIAVIDAASGARGARSLRRGSPGIDAAAGRGPVRAADGSALSVDADGRARFEVRPCG